MIAARGKQRGVGWGFIPAVLLSVSLNPLNSATISVGLAVLLQVLHASSVGITWIVSGYYLGSAVAQPIMGALGDRLGYRRFAYTGLALVLLTALLAPLSHNLWVFVGWRVVQAIGTSMVYPNSIGLVRRFKADRLSAVLGWIGMAAGIALAVGPALGGLLMGAFGWQAIFWLNIPIAVAAAILFAASVPHDRGRPRLQDSGWDWSGSVLFSVTMILLLLATSGTVQGLGLTLGALGLLALAVLVFAERRSARPVIPVRWFLTGSFAAVAGATILTNVVMYLALYGIPVVLETRRHLSVSQSGLMLLVFAGVMALCSPLGGRISRGPLRRGPYMGAAVVLVVAGILAWSGQSRNLLWVGLSLALMGLSFAVTNVVLQQMVLEVRPPGEAGSASGLYSLLRYVGTMASSVVITLAFRGPHRLWILYGSLLALSSASVLLGLAMPRRREVTA
ncbi:MFS transporter [Sulfobacillus harzensis]|uniref:MFS transporter n=1 Tax=Sulfobacillus harzensis TaxID=2729629 RepID=A0A7Y0Q2R8_9FIRM|nr:MFS transporter [Sulfobacillus harzensis]NMP21439.1 MFS transporter [Sulfobacillus harzensis]